MSKPRLTARIVRGLHAVHALAQVNAQVGGDSELYVACNERSEVDEINDAIGWLGRLIAWHESKGDDLIDPPIHF